MSNRPFRALALRLINPLNWVRIYYLQRNRKRRARVYDDAQLKLYHRLLPGDHLHYGYFDNPEVKPQDISLNMIYEAQERYANLLADLVVRTDLPILDVGCGMGGLLGVLNRRGVNAMGLTPDTNQARHIRANYPNELLECKFEDIEVAGKAGAFGTIITSESLQYLDLKRALPIIDQLLAKDGRWIACDYFRSGAAAEKSGHYWDAFVRQLEEHGFELQVQTDITPNILPTIAYVHHWGTQILIPIVEYGIEKLNVKAPGVHFAFADLWPLILNKSNKLMAIGEPKQFAADKKYVLMVIERKGK